MTLKMTMYSREDLSSVGIDGLDMTIGELLAEHGHALVPIEPTEATMRAGEPFQGYDMIDANTELWWSAMVQAAGDS